MSDTTTNIEVEYEAVEQAIMQNPRGRWFLAEHARRNRATDTNRVLEAIDRLYNAALGAHDDVQLDLFARDLEDMRASIEDARRDLAAIKPREGLTARFRAAEHDLDAVASAAERATSDILSAVERLQDISEKLRADKADADLCDEIETHARGIFMASAFQDMTGQRITRLVGALNYLEHRVKAMLAMARGETPAAAS
jgi:hypothetical protein